MIYKAFYDRRGDTIEGKFTIQDSDGNPIFKRLHARSGQMRAVGTNWMRGQSPIPFSKDVVGEKYHLWLKSMHPHTKAGAYGIGEFFQISSSPIDRRLIQGPRPDLIRQDIGLHAENQYPGSAGCIVIVDTDKAYNEVFPFLRDLGKSQEFIELVVL